MYDNWHLKTLFGRRNQARTLSDGWVDGLDPLFPRQERMPFWQETCLWLCQTYPWEHIVN